jgi:glycosyltransferase involved in cell wall biosynthesis
VRLWYQDRILRDAACLHVNSMKEAAEVRALGFANPIAVIPAGFDSAAFDARRISPAAGPWPELRERPFFLYLARIHPSKGIGLLLEAWKAIEAQHPETSLLVVGAGEPGHIAEFQQKARRWGIEHRCVWKGYATEDGKIGPTAMRVSIVCPATPRTLATPCRRLWVWARRF